MDLTKLDDQSEHDRVSGATPNRKYWRKLTFLPEEVKQSIVDRWNAGETGVKIARDFNVTSTAIHYFLGKRGAPRRRHPSGPAHSGWKGGVKIFNGYRAVFVADDSPFASMRMPSTWYALEHRLVMAQKLGRLLTSGEQVHHIDCNRVNNAPENLQLRRGAHGAGGCFVCGDCGSQNVIAVGIKDPS